MRLLAYTDNWTPGGSEAALATLLQHLDPAIDVTVMGTVPSIVTWVAQHRPSAEIRIVRPVRDRWDLRGMIAHLGAVRKVRPDIMHVNLPIPWSAKYAILAGLLVPGVKVVVVDHAPVEPHNRQVQWAKRLQLRWISAHVAASKALATYVESTARLRPGSVRVIYTGVPDLGPPARRPSPSGSPVVGTIARLIHEKGIDILLRALGELPDVTGVIVGDGPDRDSLRDLARDLGVSERVEWLGWRDDARQLLGSFDVFALASRFEGICLAVTEAALAERPIVATNVGGVPEAVDDGETGVLVRPEDPAALATAIRNLLDDDLLARRLGERARIVALDRFDPMKTAREYERLYEEIVRS